MPFAPPYTISPTAAAFASLVMMTGTVGKKRFIFSTTLIGPFHGRLGAFSIVPR